MTAPHPARPGAPRCGHEHRVVRVTAGKDGWLWTRYLLEGTRIRPFVFWSYWLGGDSVEFLARSYELCPGQVQAAIRWSERRSAAAKRGRAGK